MSDVERLATEIRGLLRRSHYDPATWWCEGSDDLPAALSVDLIAAGWRHGGEACEKCAETEHDERNGESE